jgi:hypothetical protein
MFRFNQVKLLAVVLIFSACKKEEPQTFVVEDCSSAYTHLSEDVKQINYKVGTYWIMYDSVSKKIDSLVVSSNHGVNLMEYPTNKGQCQPKADRIVHGVTIYNYDSLGKSTKCPDEKNYVLLLGIEAKEVVIHGYPNGYPYSTPDISPVLIYIDYSSTALPQTSYYPAISKLDSVYIVNHYYTKVIKASHGLKGKLNYYFNVSSGFLKFQSIDSTGVELFNRVLLRKKILK